MTDATFTAVCGQKCGPVAVPSLDTTNCPNCGHPLTSPPAVAATPAAAQGAIPPEIPPTPTPAPGDTLAERAAAILVEMGFPADEAQQLTNAALEEIARRKAAPPQA